jgi:hypothetical protein
MLKVHWRIGRSMNSGGTKAGTRGMSRIAAAAAMAAVTTGVAIGGAIFKENDRTLLDQLLRLDPAAYTKAACFWLFAFVAVLGVLSRRR